MTTMRIADVEEISGDERHGLPPNASITQPLAQHVIDARVKEVIDGSESPSLDVVTFLLIKDWLAPTDSFAPEDEVLSTPEVAEGIETALDELHALKKGHQA